MFAVIRTQGKQFKVAQGEQINIPLLEGEVGAQVTFDDVLATGDEKSVKLGKPTVSGAKVTATIVSHARAKKVLIWKHMRRKNYKKKRGHRQDYTRVRIEQIQA